MFSMYPIAAKWIPIVPKQAKKGKKTKKQRTDKPLKALS